MAANPDGGKTYFKELRLRRQAEKAEKEKR